MSRYTTRSTCKDCHERFTNLGQHRRDVHADRIVVRYPGSLGMRVSRVDGLFHCSRCGAAYSNSSAFQTHATRCEQPPSGITKGDSEKSNSSGSKDGVIIATNTSGDTRVTLHSDSGGAMNTDEEDRVATHPESSNIDDSDNKGSEGEGREGHEYGGGDAMDTDGEVWATVHSKSGDTCDSGGEDDEESGHDRGESRMPLPKGTSVKARPNDAMDTGGEVGAATYPRSGSIHNCDGEDGEGSESGEDYEDDDYEDDHDHEDDEDDQDYEDDEESDGVLDTGRVRDRRSTRRLPWGPETLQSPEMQQLGIVINRDHHVAICLVCNSAIVPSHLYEHIHKPGHHDRRDFHNGQRLSFATRDFFQRLIKRHKLEDPHLQQPTAIITPVFGLPVHEGFYCCCKCGYAVQTEKVIRRHQNLCKGDKFFRGSCQTWFPSSRRGYFAVKSRTHSNPDPLDPVALFIKQFSLDPYENIPVQANTHPRDMNIFLTYENWLKEVEGMTGAEMHNIAWDALPKLRPKVREAVSQYASALVKDLAGTGPAERLSIGDYDNSGRSTSWFNPLQEDSQEGYAKTGTDMVLFCIGFVFDQFPHYRRPVEHTQRMAANRLLEALQYENTGSGKKKQQDALQHLLLTLFTQNKHNLSRYTLTVYRFLILYSFRREGCLAKSGTITQYISRIVFFGRGAIFNEIKKLMTKDKKGHFSIEPTFRPYLSLQSDYVLSAIYHSRNLLKKFRRDQDQNVNTNLVDNFRTIIIGKTAVTLSSIGSMFHKLLDEIKERREALLMGVDLEGLITYPNALVDEPDNITPGFYFGDIPENKLKRYEQTLVRLVFGHRKMSGMYGSVTPDGNLVLDHPRCYKFLEEAASIRSALGTLLHICTSGPYRGTEFAATCVRNTADGNIRNVKVIFGRLCLVSGYNKTSSTNQELKVNYRFIPKCAWLSCIIDFVVFRPFESLLAHALRLENAGDKFLSRLFPGLPPPTLSGDISASLKRDTLKFLGSGLGLRDWRHVTVGFSRAHKDPNILQIRHVDPDNQIRGHTNETSNSNYAITPDDPVGVGLDKIRSHLQAAHWWFHLTGIRSGDFLPASGSSEMNEVIKKLDNRIIELEAKIPTAVTAGVVAALHDPEAFRHLFAGMTLAHEGFVQVEDVN